MEKKTLDTLRTMICGELDDIAKKGIVSHENLDILKDLLESAKNLEKIEKYQNEKEEKEMDMGYSQRKYYIDADYNPYQPMNSYARGGRGMGNSYGLGADYMGGNSYMYYDQGYPRGYSMAGSKMDMITELSQMMAEAQDESVKKAISEAMTKIK